ncbi:MAG TPA: cupin domain-containing protein [Caulobacteraceae bacterium]|jgi:predicted cupin superfamily sugar epimerase|nr:cupin domain-containing protein [Caulobacteraceae bacterium]
MPTAQAVIAELGLAPHPEGGWYRETWRAPPAAPGQRGGGTAILFLLEAGQGSHWHRVDATELWLFQAGAALTLSTPAGSVRLGPDVTAGDRPQHVVAPHEWQTARAADDGWSLVACVVVPAFDFAGFELAPPGWAPPPLSSRP